jgi:asparagine synthase (glutamine-hydrolysing)
VEELLSEESLRRTGYFEPANVTRWRNDVQNLRRGSLLRMSIEMCLVGVVSTQLWHHSYIDSSLSSLPSMAGQFPGIPARPSKVRSSEEITTASNV